MDPLLKILKITQKNIANEAGISQAAVSQGSPTVRKATNALIRQAASDPIQKAVVTEVVIRLEKFIARGI